MDKSEAIKRIEEIVETEPEFHVAISLRILLSIINRNREEFVVYIQNLSKQLLEKTNNDIIKFFIHNLNIGLVINTFPSQYNFGKFEKIETRDALKILCDSSATISVIDNTLKVISTSPQYIEASLSFLYDYDSFFSNQEEFVSVFNEHKKLKDIIDYIFYVSFMRACAFQWKLKEMIDCLLKMTQDSYAKEVEKFLSDIPPCLIENTGKHPWSEE